MSIVRAKFGDSWFKQSPIYLNLWPAGPVLHTFVKYLVTFCSRLETASDVISGKFVGPIVPNKSVKFCDPRLNLSGEIEPEVVEGGIFHVFFKITSDRK